LGDTLAYLNRPWNDVFGADVDALYAFLARYGIDAGFDKFSKTFIREYEDASAVSQLYKVEVPIQDIITRVFRKVKVSDSEGAVVQRAIEAFYRPEIQAWELYPDAIDCLNALQRMGFKMGLLSNTKSDWAVRAILAKHNLTEYFGVIITSAQLGIRKPRLDIFLRALSTLKAKPAEAVFVGDSLEADVIGAKTAGIRSVHVRRKIESHQHLVTPDATVENLTEAIAQIERWNSIDAGNISTSG